MSMVLLVCDTCGAVLGVGREGSGVLPSSGSHVAADGTIHDETKRYRCETEPPGNATPAQLLAWGERELQRGDVTPLIGRPHP